MNDLYYKKICEQMDQELYEKYKDASSAALYRFFGPFLILQQFGENHEKKIFTLYVICYERGICGKDLVEANDAAKVMEALTEDVREIHILEGTSLNRK